MRHKILALYEGRTTDDSEYAPLLRLPDHASPATGLGGFGLDPGSSSVTAMMLATEIRSTIKGALTWKEMVRGKHGRAGDGNKEQVGVNEEDEGEGGVEEEESEGEEEAIEQEEMMEAAAEAVESAAKRKEEEGNNDDDDVDDEMEG